MKKHFTYQDEKSHKFWDIETNGNAFTVTYGKVDTTGQQQTKTFASDEECQKAAEKLIAEKTKKGYVANAENPISENAVVEKTTKQKINKKNAEVGKSKTKSTFTKEEAEAIEKLAQSGNVNEVLAWLDLCKKEGRNWQDCKCDEYGSSLGDWAVLSESLPLLRALLAYPDFSFEQRNKNGYRPLHVAAKIGNLEVVRFLVEEAKAKVDIKGNFEFITRHTDTPLYTAIDQGHTDAALYLIDYTTELNAICNSNIQTTAVSRATDFDNIPALKKLLKRGASPNGVNSHEKSNSIEYITFPLQNARSREAVELLIKYGADVNAVNKNGESALYDLVRNNPTVYPDKQRGEKIIEALQALIDAGITVKEVEKSGYNRVNLFSNTKSATVRNILREALKKQGDKVNNGRIIWELSNDLQVENIAEFMIDIKTATKEDVNYIAIGFINEYRYTILHNILYAARCTENLAPFRDVILLLLEKGADPNAVEILNGNNALLKAIDIIDSDKTFESVTKEEYEKIIQEIIRAIVQAGGDPHYVNPESRLNSFERLDLIDANWLDILGKEIPSLNRYAQLLFIINEYMEYSYNEALPIPKKLLSILNEGSIDYEHKYDDDDLLIEKLFRMDNPEINQLIFSQIDDGTYIMEANDALYYAGIHGAINYIEHGVVHNKFSKEMLHNTDDDGSTPLMVLAGCEQKDQKDIRKGIELLVRAGANILAVDNDGDSILAYTKDERTKKFVEKLIEKVKN
jgi:predicted DNA-binding WGR domain protein/ankyrin repeat protein